MNRLGQFGFTPTISILVDLGGLSLLEAGLAPSPRILLPPLHRVHERHLSSLQDHFQDFSPFASTVTRQGGGEEQGRRSLHGSTPSVRSCASTTQFPIPEKNNGDFNINAMFATQPRLRLMRTWREGRQSLKRNLFEACVAKMVKILFRFFYECQQARWVVEER